MNVRPNLTAHAKFTMYKRKLGVPEALEYLIRLWGHCQLDKRGGNWGKVTPDYVEAVCGWMGAPMALFGSLTDSFCGKPGWVHLDSKRNVIITGWDEENKGLIAKWMNGEKGGRPTGKPTANLPVTRKVKQDSVSVMLDGTNTKPTANLTGLDRTGQDGSGDARAPFPEISLPTAEEITAHGNGPAGIPAEFCRHYHTQKNIKKSWVTRGGQLVDWKLEVQSWWASDRHTWHPVKNPAAEGDLAQWQAELEGETDPQRRHALREKITATQKTTGVAA